MLTWQFTGVRTLFSRSARMTSATAALDGRVTWK
jgi:hypothetical protein